jgi:predicted XRE-type DNA-binding protein
MPVSLIVDFIVTPNPPALPAAGGPLMVTFQASTDQGSSRLEADYGLDAGVPYQLTGPVRMPAASVSAIPADFSQALTLQAAGGFAPNVRINVTVRDLSTGDTFARSCRVTLEAPPAMAAPPPAAFEPAAAPREAAPLGERLQALRQTRDLTQQEVADQVGISRRQVSRVEHGQPHSEAIHDRLEKFLKEV